MSAHYHTESFRAKDELAMLLNECIQQRSELMEVLKVALDLIDRHADTLHNAGEHPDNVNGFLDTADAALYKAEGKG